MCFCQVLNNNRLYLVQVPEPNHVSFCSSSFAFKNFSLGILLRMFWSNFIKIAPDSGSDCWQYCRPSIIFRTAELCDVEQPASQVAAPLLAHAAVLAVVQKLDSQLNVQGYVFFLKIFFDEWSANKTGECPLSSSFSYPIVLNADPDRDTAIFSVRIQLRHNLDYISSHHFLKSPSHRGSIYYSSVCVVFYLNMNVGIEPVIVEWTLCNYLCWIFDSIVDYKATSTF